jgi:glutamyl-tRNA synthetase
MLPQKPWTHDTWAQWTETVKAATGRKGKGLYRPLRRALTGRETGPEMADVMPLLQVVKAG